MKANFSRLVLLATMLLVGCGKQLPLLLGDPAALLPDEPLTPLPTRIPTVPARPSPPPPSPPAPPIVVVFPDPPPSPTRYPTAHPPIYYPTSLPTATPTPVPPPPPPPAQYGINRAARVNNPSSMSHTFFRAGDLVPSTFLQEGTMFFVFRQRYSAATVLLEACRFGAITFVSEGNCDNLAVQERRPLGYVWPAGTTNVNGAPLVRYHRDADGDDLVTAYDSVEGPFLIGLGFWRVRQVGVAPYRFP